MSLAIRIKEYVHIAFMTFPNGLNLGNIEKIIEIHEGKYFDKDEAQSLIVDCMCFMKKSKIEQRNITKFYSRYRSPQFWNFKDGKYFLSDDKFKLNDETRDILEEIKNSPKEIKKYNNLNLELINLINSLTIHPKGINLNKLYDSFLEFNKKFNLHTEIAKEYDLNEDELIEDSFVEIMGFASTEPYDSVYLTKKDEEKLKKGGFAHEPFNDWEYRDGLYYPTQEWLEKNKEGIKKSEKAIKSLVNKLENKTLLNQVNQYCILKEKTNTDFLRMHLFMQSNLEKSRFKD